MLFYLDKDYLQCLHKVYLHTLYLHKDYFQCLCTFLFFFYLGFTALSRIFCLYCTNCSSKVAENRRIQGKTTWPSVSRVWLSHMWLEWGSNHSSEKPKLVYLHIVYLHRLFPSICYRFLTDQLCRLNCSCPVFDLLFQMASSSPYSHPFSFILFIVLLLFFFLLICHFCHLPFFPSFLTLASNSFSISL